MQESELERVKLKAGDLLIVEGNGSIDQIGRVALWDGSIETCVHQNHLIKARLSSEIIPKYALYYLLSPKGREQIKIKASSTSGLHTLSISKIESLTIPITTKDQQARIIEDIESRLSLADHQQQVLDQSLRNSNLLKNRILNDAFSGKMAI